ncbi:MAG TPA: phosphatase PAP2 family protein [Acidimicrobiales bacterium]
MTDGSEIPSDLAAAVRSGRTSARPRWWPELLLLGGGYGLYHLAQIHAPRVAATRHGWNILAWERSAKIGFDLSINRFVAARSWLAVPADYYYATLHFLVPISVLVWLWRSHPDWYRQARRVIVAGTLIALVVFWLYPSAPPRLLGGSGFIDTNVAFHTIFDVERGSSSRAADLYATMPSLHLGWALWCAWAAAGPLRRPIARKTVYLYPVLTAAVVMATGNHFFLDLIGGAAVMGLGWVASLWIPDMSARLRLFKRRRVPARVWVAAFASTIGPLAVVSAVLGGGNLAASGLHAIVHAHPIWLIVAAVAEAGSMAALAGLHRRALRTTGVAVRRRTAAAITFASNAISASLPLVGSLAGTTNTWRQYHRQGAAAPAVTWALGASGVASSLAFTLIIGLAATASGNPAFMGAGAAGTLIVLALTATVAVGTRLPALRARLEDTVTGLLFRLPGRASRCPLADPAGSVRNFIEKFGSYSPSVGDIGFAVSAGVLNWTLDALTLALAIRAAGGHLPLTDLIVVWAAAATASTVSITPSGIGVVEPVLAASMVLAGLTHSKAIAAALLYRSISVVLVVLVGWVLQWSLSRVGTAPAPAHQHPKGAALRVGLLARRPAAASVCRYQAQGALEGSHADEGLDERIAS